MPAHTAPYPGASRILENSIISTMIATFQRYNRQYPRETTVVNLLNSMVLKFVSIFFKDSSYIVFPQESTTNNVYAPIKCYRILTIRRGQLITQAFLAIAPYVSEEHIYDLAYEHLVPIMNCPCVLPITGGVPHWVILVTGTEEISVRFFYNRPAINDLEDSLRPICWSPTFWKLQQTTIHERLELDPSLSLLDGTLRKLEELSAIDVNPLEGD